MQVLHIFRVTHKDFSVSDLPELSREEVEVAVAAIRAEENLPPPKQKCNLCEESPNDAIVWCKDCQKCICDDHLKVRVYYDNLR